MHPGAGIKWTFDAIRSIPSSISAGPCASHPLMTAPKKPGGNMSWFDYIFGVASRKARSTWSDMREEYRAGLEGRSTPQASPRPASPAASSGPAWWEILHLPPGATLPQAAAAYRALIQKNHPDKVAHLSERIRRVADEETRRINAAYAEAQRLLGPGGRNR